MKRCAQTISWLSLVLLTSGPVLFYLEQIGLNSCKSLMLAGTIIWFATASFWMGRSKA